MSRESFEDPEIAALLNETFVPIKVDREELPAVDSYYITISRIFTGGGGWPLTILMTPKKIPFPPKPNIPRESRPNMVSLRELIPPVASCMEPIREPEEMIARLRENR